MRYFDTSFVTPLVRSEATSASVLTCITGLEPEELAISGWAKVELASALARDVRIGLLKSDEARKIRSDFDEIVADSFMLLTPSADDFALAEDYVHRYETGLRGGDALHLAIARNHGAVAVHSLDIGMIKAGQLLGLPISDAGVRTS